MNANKKILARKYVKIGVYKRKRYENQTLSFLHIFDRLTLLRDLSARMINDI